MAQSKLDDGKHCLDTVTNFHCTVYLIGFSRRLPTETHIVFELACEYVLLFLISKFIIKCFQHGPDCNCSYCYYVNKMNIKFRFILISRRSS
jgi:hypothetical protein